MHWTNLPKLKAPAPAQAENNNTTPPYIPVAETAEENNAVMKRIRDKIAMPPPPPRKPKRFTNRSRTGSRNRTKSKGRHKSKNKR